jgi:aconitase B
MTKHDELIEAVDAAELVLEDMLWEGVDTAWTLSELAEARAELRRAKAELAAYEDAATAALAEADAAFQAEGMLDADWDNDPNT